MERQQKGKRACFDVPFRTTIRPCGPFLFHLFQDLNLNSESREGFGSADSMVISALRSSYGAQRAVPDLLLIQVV